MTESSYDAIDPPLARAVVYRMLSIGLQPPTDARLEEIGALDGFPTVAAALRRADHADYALEQAAARLTSMPIGDAETLATSYWRLFGHTTRGLICACETEYGPDNGFHQPQQLADINGYYLAFGLCPALASDVRADHIACECEFMDVLNRKEAWLLSSGALTPDDHETLAVTREASRTFLRDHLGRFGRAFGARVAAEDPDGYFGVLGHILLAFLDSECARVAVEGGAVDLAVRLESIDDTPMACGSAGQLLQIQHRP